jgi:hypothetical protein
MAHRFDRSQHDPYVISAQAVEAEMFEGDYQRGAQEQAYDQLSNAIVTALGDIAAQAYRLGINDPKQIKGLATAVSKSADAVFASYRGEVDPEPALQAIENDPRQQSLTDEARDKLRREIEKTRQIEHLVLRAKRLPELFDFAGSLDLHVPQDAMEQGELLVGKHPTPTAGTQ